MRFFFPAPAKSWIAGAFALLSPFRMSATPRPFSPAQRDEPQRFGMGVPLWTSNPLVLPQVIPANPLFGFSSSSSPPACRWRPCRNPVYPGRCCSRCVCFRAGLLPFLVFLSPYEDAVFLHPADIFRITAIGQIGLPLL